MTAFVDPESVNPELRSLFGDPRPVGRRAFIVTSLGAGFAAAVLPVSAQTITTSSEGLVAGEVKVPVQGGEIPGYRAMPSTGNSFPTILVVQEVFGVHEWIKDVCRRLAKMGYYAIAPELYARQGDPTKISDTNQLMKDIVSKVPDAQVLSDLDAAAAYAKSTGKADTGTLGVTGFCWGGRIVWMYAGHNPNLKAAVAWYGPVARNYHEGDKTAMDIVSDIKAPVLGLYGGADPGIPKDSLDKINAAMKSAGKTIEIVVHPDTPHGFLADYRPSYRKEAAEDGWKRMSAWFDRYLGGADRQARTPRRGPA
ncbi:MAG: dienelactone hydrolase family protein [Betaproteobacteria bacterium]|nr:MAG: dienelactone hydrolase family protein [Betaproteobacteria bacterium]